MKKWIIATLLAAGALSAQEPHHIMIDKVEAGNIAVQAIPAMPMGPMGVGATMGGNIKGAPYSAEIVIENIQTLADGNRIIQKSSGSIARDSMGRMRHEAVIPVIANMTAANPPRLVFISDPVSDSSWSLNLAEKTATKTFVRSAMPLNSRMSEKMAAEHHMTITTSAPATAGAKFDVVLDSPRNKVAAEGFQIVADKKAVSSQFTNESLGSKVMEGVVAEGTRNVRTIPAGEIGNDKPIEIVNETWTSTDLKTLVYSRRSDPRTGEQIYRLTNIQRSEPDASLFSVPADFKVNEPGDMKKDVIFYRTRD